MDFLFCFKRSFAYGMFLTVYHTDKMVVNKLPGLKNLLYLFVGVFDKDIAKNR